MPLPLIKKLLLLLFTVALGTLSAQFTNRGVWNPVEIFSQFQQEIIKSDTIWQLKDKKTKKLFEKGRYCLLEKRNIYKTPLPVTLVDAHADYVYLSAYGIDSVLLPAGFNSDTLQFPALFLAGTLEKVRTTLVDSVIAFQLKQPIRCGKWKTYFNGKLKTSGEYLPAVAVLFLTDDTGAMVPVFHYFKKGAMNYYTPRGKIYKTELYDDWGMLVDTIQNNIPMEEGEVR